MEIILTAKELCLEVTLNLLIDLAKNDKSIMDYSSIRDSRDIATMPELSRSTLMDQIDYDLDNFKINESSV